MTQGTEVNRKNELSLVWFFKRNNTNDQKERERTLADMVKEGVVIAPWLKDGRAHSWGPVAFRDEGSPS